MKDLSIVTVKSIREIEEMMNRGNGLRKTGATAMNDTSSRSHSLFAIYIETAQTVSDDLRQSLTSITMPFVYFLSSSKANSALKPAS